jgi:hypothetical protein
MTVLTELQKLEHAIALQGQAKALTTNCPGTNFPRKIFPAPSTYLLLTKHVSGKFECLNDQLGIGSAIGRPSGVAVFPSHSG